jgi:hypothetical protein
MGTVFAMNPFRRAGEFLVAAGCEARVINALVFVGAMAGGAIRTLALLGAMPPTSKLLEELPSPASVQRSSGHVITPRQECQLTPWLDCR